MPDWDLLFHAWSKPSSPTEQEKCEAAVNGVRSAIERHAPLSGRDIGVFPQGSYHNNTNVRQESDVDICVRCNDPFYTDFSMSGGLTKADVGVVDSPYTYVMFKEEVGRALRSYFGDRAITRGDKAFDVHATSSRVDADVVACLLHRRYRSNKTYLRGTEFRSDSGKKIVNWPDQQHESGNGKNDATGRRFKRVTRVLKRIRYSMEDDEGMPEASGVASFLIECLCWNVPNDLYGGASLADDVYSALRYLAESTATEEACNGWVEVSEMKYLLRGDKAWTREQANKFLVAAGRFVELWG